MNPSDRITRLTPREWLISIAIHAVIFGLLIWFTPARDVLESLAQKNPPPTKQPRQDPTQVHEVVREISQEQAEVAKQHVAQLLDLEKTLDQLAKDRLKEFNKQAQTIAADAAQKALDQLKQIPPGQETALQMQNQLSQQLQNLFPNSTSPSPDSKTLQQMHNQFGAMQQTIGQDQIKTQEDQEKAAQLIHFLGQDTPAAQAQQKAIDAENAAALSQQNAVAIQNQLLDNLGGQTWQVVNANRENAKVVKIQTALDAIEPVIAQDQVPVNAAKAQLDAAVAAFNQAFAFAMSDKKPEDWQKKDQANKVVEQARQAYYQAKNAQDRDTIMRGALRAQLQTQQGQARYVDGILNATQTQFAKLQSQLQTGMDTSKKDQTAAEQAQLDSITQLTAMVNGPAAAPAAPPAPAELATDKELDPSTLQHKDLGQLYETAKQTEDRITDKYKVYRAAEFGSIQKLTMADALQATQVAKPNREKLDTQLLSAKGATKQFAAYKAEVSKAKQQIQSMVALSSDMVLTAEAQEEVGRGDVKLQEDKYDDMVASAMDDAGAAGKDLTAGNEEGAGDEIGAGGSNGRHGGGGEHFDDAGSHSGHVKEYNRNAPELPNMDYNNLKPYATRQFNENGPHHADWFYVDSWYLIGPFPNEGRANLNTKFPPESIIDLDAVYPGKGGRPLRWVYTQWNTPNLSPAHDVADAPAIYYAYTELFFDRPQDLWIATGSDDKGTMWLNNVMVWNSNDILKWWHPNEGYRKVHFNQGRNRILYRLENGQLTAIFSLMISAKTD